MSLPRIAIRILLAVLLAAVGGGESRAGQATRQAEQGAPAHPASRDEPRGQKPGSAEAVRSLGLAETIRIARQRSPLLRAKELEAEAAELDVRRVEDALQLPEVVLEGRTGVVPEARGDVFESPDSQNDLDGLGPFVQLDVGVTMPVFGWGRLRHLRSAARSGVNARAAQRDAAAADLAVEVSRAYWGLVAAARAVEVAGELRDEYQEILDQVEERLAADEIDDTDALEVQALRYDIEKTWHDASFDRERARAALAELLGLDAGVTPEAAGEPSPELGVGEDAASALVSRGTRNHPRLRALESAADALDARLDLERSERAPLFVVGGLFGFAHAPNRDDQTNPFVYDPWNRITVAAAVGFQWDLNFARHSLQIARARIERDTTEAQARALRSKVTVDVRAAHEQVVKDYELLEEARRTRRVTRRWLRVAADNWDLGIGDAETLLKAYRQDYRLQGVVIERQYELNVSLAELAAVLGEFDLYLRWFRDGQVALD